jgi:DNA helicase HerA-like ATPase
VGKVASPPRRESTSEEFFFWVAQGVLVEKTQIVCTQSTVAGQDLWFYGVVREVYRQGREGDLGEGYDRYDGDVTYRPPFDVPGFTYAAVTILRTEPAVLTPPMEGSDVFLGGAEEARLAYNADEIEHPLAVGLIKNGGSRRAGPGMIDLDYLLGANGGHLNVNGVAGRGTKSSFLLHVNYLLLREAQRQREMRQSDPNRLRVVPIILNVKNFDLFHIDRRSRRYDPSRHDTDWHELGINDAGPFRNVTFLAPQMRGQDNPVDTGRPCGDVRPYSWSLADVVERGLLAYLFAEEDVRDANFGALVLDLENWLTHETVHRNGERERRLSNQAGRPQTFDELLREVQSWTQGTGGTPFSGQQHHQGTLRKLYRRLLRLVYEGDGVLRRDDHIGRPLAVTAQDTADPVVIDLSALAVMPSLQRFVVATIFRQLVDDRTGSNVQRGLVYLVTLDELNRFAPAGAHDPITKLIEHVAGEMRSQGIILLGAQQQASLVAPRVIENCGVRAVGKTGPVELGNTVWRFLSDSARRKAGTLQPTEKLLIQDSFREPMLVHVPFPPWAMRGEEAVDDAPAGRGVAELDAP